MSQWSKPTTRGLEETSSDDEKFLEKNEFLGKEDGKGGDGDDTSSEKRWRNAISVQRITGNVDAHVVGSGDMAAHFDVCGGQSALRTARGSIELMVNHRPWPVELEALDERNLFESWKIHVFRPQLALPRVPRESHVTTTRRSRRRRRQPALRDSCSKR